MTFAGPPLSQVNLAPPLVTFSELEAHPLDGIPTCGTLEFLHLLECLSGNFFIMVYPLILGSLECRFP